MRAILLRSAKRALDPYLTDTSHLILSPGGNPYRARSDPPSYALGATTNYYGFRRSGSRLPPCLHSRASTDVAYGRACSGTHAALAPATTRISNDACPHSPHPPPARSPRFGAGLYYPLTVPLVSGHAIAPRSGRLCRSARALHATRTHALHMHSNMHTTCTAHAQAYRPSAPRSR